RRSAVNAALDIVRARREAPGVDLERMASPGPDPELGDLQKHLRLALGTLPVRSAEVFILRHFEGHKNPEIAKILGISQLVVAVTLHRARKALQKELIRLGVKR
ncbi:MAG: sigma-70 family RNA polymerase sigma factor, partial [Acidobacteriota bacterium]